MWGTLITKVEINQIRILDLSVLARKSLSVEESHGVFSLTSMHAASRDFSEYKYNYFNKFSIKFCLYFNKDILF